MYIADALSRATKPTEALEAEDKSSADDIFHYHIILPATDEKLNQIRKAAERSRVTNTKKNSPNCLAS